MSKKPKPLSAQKKNDPGRKLAESRAEMLRAMLPHTSACLNKRQANLIGDELIADYVALDWLEWQGGGLRLTITGRNTCQLVEKERA